MKMATETSLSGYDCNFLTEPPDDLKCLICLAVARDPRQHEECGKLFCSECIEKYGTDKPCPNCKKTGAFYKDHKSKRNIAELQVKCDNVKRKCEWVGTIGTLQAHVDTCEFALVPCPRKCKEINGITKHVLKKFLHMHLEMDCPNRNYTCAYCEKTGTYASILAHDKICEKKPVTCPVDGCSKKMIRLHVQKHVKMECEHVLVPCKYISIGCGQQLKRKDMAVHEENDRFHLHMAIDTTNELKRDLEAAVGKISATIEEKYASLEEKCDMIEDKCVRTLRNGEPIKLKLDNYKKKKDANTTVHSLSYYTTPNGYHICIRVFPNGGGGGKGTHVSVYAVFLKGRYDSKLNWPFVGKITFTLMNQLEDDNHIEDIINLTPERKAYPGNSRGFHEFILSSELGYDSEDNSQYLKDDTLYFQMLVEGEGAENRPWLQ